MNSRSTLMVSLLSVAIASSATSTSAGSAIDLANYFPVGKREVKFVIASVQAPTTSTGFVANVTIQESDSTTTTAFTNVLAYDGSTLTVSNTDGTHLLVERPRGKPHRELNFPLPTRVSRFSGRLWVLELQIKMLVGSIPPSSHYPEYYSHEK
jgi:hypothetical protein